MISTKRLAKIKREIEKTKGKPVIIKFEDGSELRVMPTIIQDSFVRFKEETDFIRAIKGKEIVSCSSLGKLISVIKQLSERRGEELAE